MTKLTVEQIDFLDTFFAERALALRDRITNKEYDDAEELGCIEEDIKILLSVEYTDIASAKSALGCTDSRDDYINMIEEDDNAVGHQLLDTMYPM